VNLVLIVLLYFIAHYPFTHSLAVAVMTQDVHLTLLDRVAIKDVHKLLSEDDPLAFTLVLSGSAANSSNKVTR
jgi:hypothetical protein